ncbi:MAG: hypothetical protein ACK5QC_16685 [Bacteroidota bacterium]|jgi:hypothetical protein|nr:hypothetical protein [Bacteroidota bacterium]MCA6443209.1 hypothetical protein [Bacteroidota bacterium]
MKDVFLVNLKLPESFTKELYNLIPEQRAVVNQLLDNRVVLSYSLDMDRKNVWAYIEAVSEQEVMDILSTFPIIKYVKTTIHELAFYDTAPVGMPELILN